jgi:hypothetical protein
MPPGRVEQPLQLYRIQLTRQKKNSSRTGPHNREEKQDETPLICSHCSAAITTAGQAVAVNGQYEHAFFNPAGIAFEIRCFRLAPGCRLQGKPTTEFSWFQGYSWQFAHCDTCLMQLGWFFMSVEKEKTFFGLMTGRVI